VNKPTALSQLYDRLFRESIDKICKGEILPDGMIDQTTDRRRGLTLLIRPTDNIKDGIYRFQKEMKSIDNEQHYQPATDLHVTALSIISCYDGFDLNEIDVPDYIRVISESIKEISKINLNFHGITASPEAVMIQGFPTDDGLKTLRERLRKNFGMTDLQQSIDSRYQLSTAHITSIRFRKALDSPARFAALLQQYREVDFGRMEVESVDLVYNDWYLSDSITKTLHRFRL